MVQMKLLAGQYYRIANENACAAHPPTFMLISEQVKISLGHENHTVALRRRCERDDKALGLR